MPALARRLAAGAEIEGEVLDACHALNRLYIPTRYPDAHEEDAPVDLYGERDARDALRDLQTVATFASTFGGPPPP
ncbi:MAG: HEPN domain-containing protein [Candidatus Xenobia bacterium]